jgi:hypothetical protein
MVAVNPNSFCAFLAKLAEFTQVKQAPVLTKGDKTEPPGGLKLKRKAVSVIQ